MTNDDERFEEEFQFQESWLRYTAAIPARDDAERDLYRDWAELDDWTPRAVMYGSASELRGKTHDELRELARHEAAIALLTGSPEHDSNTGPRRSPSGEGRAGVRVPAMSRFSRLRDWHAQRAGRRDPTWQAPERGPAEAKLRAGRGREPRPITDFVWSMDPETEEADKPAVKADPGGWGGPWPDAEEAASGWLKEAHRQQQQIWQLITAGLDAERAAYDTDVRSEIGAALSAAQRAGLIADRELIEANANYEQAREKAPADRRALRAPDDQRKAEPRGGSGGVRGAVPEADLEAGS